MQMQTHLHNQINLKQYRIKQIFIVKKTQRLTIVLSIENFKFMTIDFEIRTIHIETKNVIITTTTNCYENHVKHIFTIDENENKMSTKIM